MTNGLTNRELARIESIIDANKDQIDWCRMQLATNFDAPANRVINFSCAKMGISRLDWEKIVAVQNGWDYEAPPAKLLRRWEAY